MKTSSYPTKPDALLSVSLRVVSGVLIYTRRRAELVSDHRVDYCRIGTDNPPRVCPNERDEIEMTIQVECVEEFLNAFMPETAEKKFHSNVVGLAEACIFYESKCTEEWLIQAKYVIKDYLELRIHV